MDDEATKLLRQLVEMTGQSMTSHKRILEQHEKNFEVTQENLDGLATLVNQQNKFLEALRLCVLQLWDRVGLPDSPTLPDTTVN